MSRIKYIYVLLVKDEIKAAFISKEELKYFIKNTKKIKEYNILSIKNGAAWMYLKGGNIENITDKIKDDIDNE
jgi:hypothetical protein